MLFVNRFGKIYYTEPNHIETINIETDSLDVILVKFDNLPRSKFEVYNPILDNTKSFVKQLKLAVDSVKAGKGCKDINLKFILKRADIDSTPTSTINKFRSILSKPTAIAKPITNSKSKDNNNQLSLW